MPTVNIRAFSHKKSTVVENGGPKLPTAAQLELGEIAINFAKGYETLSIKNNNDEIVTFTNDNYWINKEQAIAAALNDLNDRKQDALEMDEIPTEGSQNVVTSGGLYSYITEIEQVTAAALNDLNDRITSLALSDDYAAASQGTPPLAGDTYEIAISKLHKVIVDDELITSSALNDLNSRIDNLSLSEDYVAADPASEPVGGDTYEEAIGKLHGAILENELATSGALNDLNTRISDIVIPELILSEDYEPSSLSNEDLFLAPGDSYETAFAKLEKTINDNENITSAALTDLDSRLNLLHLPQSLDDIPDGSTRKLSDYATTTQLATKQDALVSGTNIKTINNQSLLGSGNITIQGGSGGGDTNVIETIKVNGTALTPDSNKAVDITVPTTLDSISDGTTRKLSDYLPLSGGTMTGAITVAPGDGKGLLFSTTSNINVSGTTNTILGFYNGTYIIGHTAYPVNIRGNATRPQYNGNQLALYSDIPSAVTESTVSGWGFTKNTGTVTGVKINGTTKNPTNGVVDLGAITGGDTNVIETVKVNGTALTPDSNKAIDITSIPASIVTQDATHRFVSDTEKTTWNGKQNALQYYGESNGEAHVYIYDEHNSGNIILANLDVESAQPITQLSLEPGNIATLETNFSGRTDPYGGHAHIKCYSEGIELKCTIDNENNDTVHLGPSTFTYNNKQIATVDQIPSAVTESTVSGWGFTKNAAPGTLNTTATTAQSTSSSEALSGNITLHKVAKTGTYNDLIGKPTIPAAQVQSDWNATSGMGVILNKPTIPTVNNATLTIQKNGTTVGTFTANASSNATANIQVNELPTVSSSDNGKILQVVNGAWALVTPTSIYSGTSEPDSNTGNNGDLYLQTS